jgi:intracellular multiplication protein IcmQ
MLNEKNGKNQQGGKEAELLGIVREVIQQDLVLREKYHIENKFRFIRDRLAALQDTLEKALAVSDRLQSAQGISLDADEMLVYVYLYNSQGLQFRTWQNLVTPKVFYEYSVNRPIYCEKEHVNALLRIKTNKAQHAYLTVVVKQEHVIQLPDDLTPKDSVGNPVIKVKEGSLRIEKLINFCHQEKEYILNPSGELVIK